MAAMMASESRIKLILKLTKQSAIYGVGHVLTKSLVILLLPIHTNTKYISQVEYGIATQLFAFLAIAAIIYSYGLNTAFLQFYIQETDTQKKNKFFSTAFFATLLTSFFLSTFLFNFKTQIAKILFSSDN